MRPSCSVQAAVLCWSWSALPVARGEFPWFDCSSWGKIWFSDPLFTWVLLSPQSSVNPNLCWTWMELSRNSIRNASIFSHFIHSKLTIGGFCSPHLFSTNSQCTDCTDVGSSYLTRHIASNWFQNLPESPSIPFISIYSFSSCLYMFMSHYMCHPGCHILSFSGQVRLFKNDIILLMSSTTYALGDFLWEKTLNV